MDIIAILTGLVGAGKLGGWIRAGVASIFVAVAAKYPIFGTLVPQDAQLQIAGALATIGVGVWSHLAKSSAARSALTGAAKRAAPLLLVGALLLGGGAALTACSNQQLTTVESVTTTYDNAVNNFTAAVAAVNGSIALTSTTVGPYCSAAQTAGQNLVKLASGSPAAVTALNTVAAALNQFCIGMPTDVQSAVVTLTNAAVAAKQAAAGG